MVYPKNVLIIPFITSCLFFSDLRSFFRISLGIDASRGGSSGSTSTSESSCRAVRLDAIWWASLSASADVLGLSRLLMNGRWETSIQSNDTDKDKSVCIIGMIPCMHHILTIKGDGWKLLRRYICLHAVKQQITNTVEYEPITYLFDRLEFDELPDWLRDFSVWSSTWRSLHSKTINEIILNYRRTTTLTATRRRKAIIYDNHWRY